MTPASPQQPLARRAASGARAVARRITGSAPGTKPPAGAAPEGRAAGLDDWLKPLFGDRLDRIEAALEGAGTEGYSEFRDLDDDLWSLLLTLEYEGWPGIRSFLPDLPDPARQRMWNGVSGPALAAQSVCFYRKLKEMHVTHGEVPLNRARTLDFGCGWGRLTRMLAKDLDPGLLYGCDPVEEILDVSRLNGVPAELGRSDFLPQSLPFDNPDGFDLVFAFSVFTHISEAAHQASIEAIHDGLKPGGLLVLTVRPPAYIDFNSLMEPAARRLGPDRLRRLAEEPLYVFEPHPTEDHPQFDDAADDPMSYGETVITMPFVRDKWTSMFDLLDTSVLTGDMYQVALTLRKRS